MDIAQDVHSHLTELTAPECWDLARDSQFGRVAWSTASGPSVLPVNLGFGDGAIWIRTSPYSALARQCSGQRVAIELDNIDVTTRSGWSVVIVGTAELVDSDEVPVALRPLNVWPSGTKNVHLRIEPVEVTGRRLLAVQPG